MSKIGMVLDAHYPDDIRVRKEANALLPKGYEIVLICYGRKGQPAEEVVNGILVKRIINVENKLVKTFHNSWMALTRQHLFFASNLSRIVKEEGIKALHVHDLPLANTSLKVARKHNIPLVLDLHENYPAMVDHNRQHQISLIQKINYNLLFRYQPWFRYERKMIHKADYVITVVEEMKERIMAMHGLPEEKIHIVGNFEEKEFWENRVLRSDEIDPLIDKNKYNLLYIGGLGAHRGLDTVLKGMTLL
ncbi:MAG: glycosyltransferase, partial [Bacteroidota bacterium]